MCATHGEVQYRCFCCNKPWHRGDHDAIACMKSLGEGYSMLRTTLEQLIADRTTLAQAEADYRLAISDAMTGLRRAEAS